MTRYKEAMLTPVQQAITLLGDTLLAVWRGTLRGWQFRPQDFARILADAKVYKAERIARAEGDAQRFDLIATEYRAAPEVTRKRLYIEAMQQVIGDTPKVIDFTNGKNLLQIPVPGASASAPSATQAAAAGISATEADKGGQ